MISSLQQKHGGTDSFGMLPAPFDRQSNLKFTYDLRPCPQLFFDLVRKNLDLKSEAI
jgi:hypothetical protein